MCLKMTVDALSLNFILKNDLQLDQNNQLIRNTLTVVLLNAPAWLVCSRKTRCGNKMAGHSSNLRVTIRKLSVIRSFIWWQIFVEIVVAQHHQLSWFDLPLFDTLRSTFWFVSAEISEFLILDIQNLLCHLHSCY